ncbi:MAG TPA: hypothetical protein VEZ89_09650 [Rubrivivax sp.]|nr:hypothetical protein [Rubrivivax sp.]
MTTITVLRPLQVQPPRAAALLAKAFIALLAHFEARSVQRSRRSEKRIRAEEAARVRAYADEVQMLDPRYAADLRAAADRHQCQD